MKTKTKLIFGMIAGFAVMLPFSVFADEQNPTQDDKQQVKKQETTQLKPNKTPPKADIKTATQSVDKSKGENIKKQDKANGSSSVQKEDRNTSNGSAKAQKSDVATTAPQTGGQVVKNQSNKSQGNSNKQYNKANNYGGLWSTANTHSDWNQSQQHTWNSHQYRWYEGGWLIIDEGYNPYASGGGSTVSNVQASLTTQGYYHGPIDGNLGAGTRDAIANYQGDHGLRASGHINDPLLQSLQLE